MTYSDQKSLAYYSMCAYASHKKLAMPIDDFFRVKEVIRTNKPMIKFIKNLKEKNK